MKTSRKHLNWIEVSAALCAVIISSVSLFIAVRQNALMERQLSASTWPVLEFETSNVDDQGNPEISFEIRNAGLGPAKVRTFQVYFGDVPLATSKRILDACCSEGEKLPPIDWITSGVNHSIITPNERVRFFRYRQTKASEVYWHRLDAARSKIKVRACYCSALDECWLMDSAVDEQQRTKTCPAQADQFVE